MKTVLLLTDLFGATGGIQTFNRSLVKAIDEISSKNGSHCSVLVLNDVDNDIDCAPYFDRKRTRYQAFNRSKSKFLAAAVKEAGTATTVVLGHINFAPMTFGLRARNSRLNILLTIFGIDAWGKLTRLQMAGLKNVQRIISISKSTRDKMTAVNSVNGTPIEILPCTLDPLYDHEIALQSRSELALPDGPMILSTSRLDARERYKRIEDVIHALPQIAQKVSDAFYVVVGDGTDRQRLEALASELGVGDRVHFAGRVQDARLASLYNTSDLFILPSTGEGFGIVFLEAMFYGKCCVGARAGATPEVIEDGVTGMLVDPDKPEELVESVVSLLSSASKRKQMGEAGRARLAAEFSGAMFTKRLQSILSAR
jgi:phosphatidyl-myo-inositol dimannoside synthase